MGSREVVRQVLHASVGGLAFLVPLIGASSVAGICLALVAWCAWVFPSVGGRWLFRPQEVDRGWSPGMILLPAALAVVFFSWADRPAVAVVACLLVTVGDGMATLVGRAFGKALLPWNPQATWVGFWSFVGAAAMAILASLWWTAQWKAGPVFDPVAPLVFAVVAAFLGAILESLPLTLDDNLVVAIGGALVVDGLLRTLPLSASMLAGVGADLAVGILFNGGLAILLWKGIGALDRAGALAGCVLGAAVWGGQGPAGWALLTAFVTFGVGASRLGRNRKQRLALVEDRRSAGNALANAGVAAVAAVFASSTGLPIYGWAAAGALAAALADTLSSEIGQAWGGRPFLITSGQRVEPGVDGGVTLVGTLASLAGAGIMAGLALTVGIVGFEGAAWVVIAGVSGSLVDSILGASIEGRGRLDNHAVNLVATFTGALVAAWGVSGT